MTMVGFVSKFGDDVVEPETEVQFSSKYGDEVLEPYADDLEPSPESRQQMPANVTPLGVLGEVAAGANESIIGFFDLLAKTGNLAAGGYSGVMKLLQTGDLDAAVAEIGNTQPIPELSTVINDVLAQIGTDARIGGRVMEEGTAQQVARAFGNVFGPGIMGMTQVAGRDLTRLPGQAAEFAGFGSAATAKNIPIVDAGLQSGAEKSVRRDMAVARQRGDVAGAGFKADDMGRAIPDPAQQKAIKGGLSKPVVAQVSQASTADKKKIGQMLDVVEAGLENKTVGDFNLPRSVLGDSMYERYQVVKNVNDKAGEAVRVASDELRDIPLSGRQFLDGPVRRFFENLKSLDVEVNFDDGTLNFSRSAFRGSPSAQKVLRKVMKDFKDTPFESYYDLHTFKLFIDDMVEEYGKSAKGLSGRTERIVKMLRHDVNEFIRDASENYAAANDVFSESIDVLNEADRLVGRYNSADSRSLARAARKAVSNYATGDQMQDLLVSMDELAKKYGADFADDLKTQVSVVQTIEKLFPTARPPASFAGDIDKVASWMSVARGDKVGMAAKGGQYIMKKLAKDDDAKLADTLSLLRSLVEESPK